VFEPEICGVEQAGVIEIIEMILEQYTAPIRRTLLQNVYVTGGFSQVKGVIPRIRRELRMIADVDTPIVVRYSEDPMFDPWRGAALFCREEEMENCWLTLKDYKEKGPDYLKEHSCSNINVKFVNKDITMLPTRRKKYL
jgi:actin-related protein 5